MSSLNSKLSSAKSANVIMETCSSSNSFLKTSIHFVVLFNSSTAMENYMMKKCNTCIQYWFSIEPEPSSINIRSTGCFAVTILGLQGANKYLKNIFFRN
eukprot:UN26435